MLTCIVDNVHMLAVLLWNVNIFEIQRELLNYNVTQVYGQSHTQLHPHSHWQHTSLATLVHPHPHTHPHLPSLIVWKAKYQITIIYYFTLHSTVLQSILINLQLSKGGFSTEDEMCLAFLTYYPRVNLSGCYSRPDMALVFDTFGIQDLFDNDM